MDGETLPPNQVVTSKWPVIGERVAEPFDEVTWRLSVIGLAERTLSLTFAELAALPRIERRGTIHCVTRWSRPATAFRGVAVETLLSAARPFADARFVRFVSGRGHDTSLPLEACRGDVLIALEYEDGGRFVPIPPGHGGPVRSVVFRRYFYKSVKWLRTVELLSDDHLGFWERTAGYHNEADPWREQRYVARAVSRTGLARLFAAKSLARQDLLGADLSGADLRGFDLTEASLRNANLTGADLRDADLRAANLTNAVLTGADLRGARLDAVDLDGADLRRADLRGATGSPASLAVAEFTRESGGTERGTNPPPSDGARVDGLDWSQARLDGLLPEQEAYLRRAGVRLP